ncbi:MAG: ARMT1-like domain-containing protein [candidate division Zixibacteria bacterium]|nr:ARMT1-like domain-containing protein [candidate division Zixibacteria bacterium]
MKTYLDCFPCFLKQALNAVRFTTADEKLHEKVMHDAIKMAASMDPRQTPPEMGRQIHRLIRELTGVADPYQEVKKQFNDYALAAEPRLRKIIEQSQKPLETAVRLAIAGNIIDFGPNSRLVDTQVSEAIEHSLSAPLDTEELETFKKSLNTSSVILYLGDNAGEIVFDRLLIEQLPLDKITFVVKGYPVINDATMSDAIATGLTELVRVIDNGHDAPGTIIDQCSDEFKKIYARADLVIAKGQGNYETLSNEDKNIFFLLKAKCPIIARHLAVELGSIVIRRNHFNLRAEQ